MSFPTKVPAPQAAAGDAAHFRHRLPIQIRFNDVDRYGHVNNNAYFAFYDLGKEDYLTNVLRVDYRSCDTVPVVANINADFITPILHGDRIVVETRIAHVGHKSFTLEQRAVNEATHEVVCRCSTVMVCFSLSAQASVEVPAPYRQAIAAYEGPEVASVELNAQSL